MLLRLNCIYATLSFSARIILLTKGETKIAIISINIYSMIHKHLFLSSLRTQIRSYLLNFYLSDVFVMSSRVPIVKKS